MLQRGEDILTMSFCQVWYSRRQRANEVPDPLGLFAIGLRRPLQERFKRHADNVGRPTAEAAGGSPERTTQRGGQSDRDLILHKRLQSCTAIVVQRIAVGKVLNSTPRYSALACL